MFCSVVVFKQINIIYMAILAINSNNTTTCHLNFMYKPSVFSCMAAEWFLLPYLLPIIHMSVIVCIRWWFYPSFLSFTVPNSKGPIWGRQDPGGPHVGPMNLAIWGVLLASIHWDTAGQNRSEQIGHSIADKNVMYIFLGGNSVYSNFTEFYFWGSNWQYISIGSWNGLGRTEISLMAMIIIT